jgi:hypothetical protein
MGMGWTDVVAFYYLLIASCSFLHTKVLPTNWCDVSFYYLLIASCSFLHTKVLPTNWCDVSFYYLLIASGLPRAGLAAGGVEELSTIS